jgi:hypothetical protein
MKMHMPVQIGTKRGWPLCGASTTSQHCSIAGYRQLQQAQGQDAEREKGGELVFDKLVRRRTI